MKIDIASRAKLDRGSSITVGNVNTEPASAEQATVNINTPIHATTERELARSVVADTQNRYGWQSALFTIVVMVLLGVMAALLLGVNPAILGGSR